MINHHAEKYVALFLCSWKRSFMSLVCTLLYRKMPSSFFRRRSRNNGNVFSLHCKKKQRVALQKYIKKTDKSMSSTINNTFFCFFFYFFILLNFGRITSVKLFCDDVVWSVAQKVLGRILKSWAFLTMLTERFYLKKKEICYFVLSK